MASSVEVRAARADDAYAIAGLLGELGYPMQPADVPGRLGTLPAAQNGVLLATGADARALGLIALHVMPVLHHATPACYITALVVHKEARGTGVGRELLDAAESWARERGCGRMTVTSAEPREEAHEFYPACGFPYTGRRYAKPLG